MPARIASTVALMHMTADAALASFGRPRGVSAGGGFLMGLKGSRRANSPETWR